jgi:hypothetical protein
MDSTGPGIPGRETILTRSGSRAHT